MKTVRITAIRQTVYPDLMAKYETPIEHTCDVREGQQWISVDGKCPEGMCPAAWYSMQKFVESLARGEGARQDAAASTHCGTRRASPFLSQPHPHPQSGKPRFDCLSSFSSSFLFISFDINRQFLLSGAIRLQI